ncbi:MAG: glycosyltransferase family protein [Patescibacteria group bacterium]|nr:glycosyltransferase family protein [Patescibacteria group bacterium]
MKRRVVAILQARTGSTRLPQKVLRPILGKPMLERMLERVKRAKTPDAIIVATTDKSEDDAVEKVARASGVGVFRGSEKDVLDRYYQAAKEAKAGIIVRLTGDCPLHDPEVIDEVVVHFLDADGSLDHIGTPRNYPEGLDTEVFTFASLERAWKDAKLPSEREHVTPYFGNHPEIFRGESWKRGTGDNSGMHWSVDTEADFRFVSEVYKALYKEGECFHKKDVLELLKRRPELLDISKGGTGREGYEKSLKEDEEFKRHD